MAGKFGDPHLVSRWCCRYKRDFFEVASLRSSSINLLSYIHSVRMSRHSTVISLTRPASKWFQPSPTSRSPIVTRIFRSTTQQFYSTTPPNMAAKELEIVLSREACPRTFHLPSSSPCQDLWFLTSHPANNISQVRTVTRPHIQSTNSPLQPQAPTPKPSKPPARSGSRDRSPPTPPEPSSVAPSRRRRPSVGILLLPPLLRFYPPSFPFLFLCPPFTSLCLPLLTSRPQQKHCRRSLRRRQRHEQSRALRRLPDDDGRLRGDEWRVREVVQSQAGADVRRCAPAAEGGPGRD